MRPTIISVSGLASNTGKTTLVCSLLSQLRGWEAIKISRGHYRSCGKSADACCISPMLGEKPLVLSGLRETFAPGKDTGRYWEAGAANVHWVVCTSQQLEQGLSAALDRVESEAVFIEGTSLLKYAQADYSIMVVSPTCQEIKSSAVGVMEKINAVFVAKAKPDPDTITELRNRISRRGSRLGDVSVYFQPDLCALTAEIERIHQLRRSSLAVRDLLNDGF